MYKVFCDECQFSRMRMKSLEKISPVDGGKWCQDWKCINPKLTTKFNAVNKPFTSESDCLNLNKSNNCKKFIEKSFLQKHGGTIGMIGVFAFIIINFIVILFNVSYK